MMGEGLKRAFAAARATRKKPEMTPEQIDKMNVRNILRDYMKTPGATMETDVFVAMVVLLQSSRREGYREGARSAAIGAAMMLRDTAKTQCFGKEDTKATLLAIADSIEASEGVNDDE